MLQRTSFVTILALLLASSAHAQPKLREAKLEKDSAELDTSLAGDLTREAEDGDASPALAYDSYRLDVELQVASKRRAQIGQLQELLALSADSKELPELLFRLAELYWEESKYYFFEANRQDDALIEAMNAEDQAGMAAARKEKARLLAKSREYGEKATDQYAEIIQRHRDFERTDEVLYFLGKDSMERGEHRKALVAFKRLISKYPDSKFVPDAHLAFGEYYFNESNGRHDMLRRAIESYDKAGEHPGNEVYGYALYKKGWAHFNLGEYRRALDIFKAVVLYGELAGDAAGGKRGGKGALIREARNDLVRAFAQVHPPSRARSDFDAVSGGDAEVRFRMMKQLANLYYSSGRDKEAAVTFNALIREQPLSPEAPVFQGKIVDSVLRAGNKRMTVAQVRRLVRIHEEVASSGVVKSDADKRALKEARDLAERTLSNIAVTWHKEAQKTRDDETFALANEVYRDYLTLFPEGAKAYDLRFFWAELLNDHLFEYAAAAEQYTKVLQVDIDRLEAAKEAPDSSAAEAAIGKEQAKPGKWMVNAAYNAVLAWEEVVEQAENAGKISGGAGKDLEKKKEIPAVRRALLEAADRYVKWVPEGEHRVEIAFKAANIFYRHNHFDEAVERFASIALKDPTHRFEDGQRAGEIAANLVLDSFNALSDWENLNRWARRFHQEPALSVGKFRRELEGVIEQSAFKLVHSLEEQDRHIEAAEAYLTFVEEFPGSKLADQALFNAGVDFFEAKRLDRAIEVRRRLIQRYPSSPFVPESLYANAEAYEAIADFRRAAGAYEQYARGYAAEVKAAERSSTRNGRGAKKGDEKKPLYDAAKAEIALFNAGIFREGLSQPKRAQANRGRFLALFPDSGDAEAVHLAAVDLYERMLWFKSSVQMLEQYELAHRRDPSKRLAAMGNRLRIYEERWKQPREAAELRAEILKVHRRLSASARGRLGAEAREAVARAHLVEGEPLVKELRGMTLRWGRGRSQASVFKKALADKAAALKKVQGYFTETVAFKAGEPAICALRQLGDAYHHMAETIEKAPMPKGAPPELKEAMRQQLYAQSMPLREEAAGAYRAAVEQGRELALDISCARASLKRLRETYRPDEFGPLVERLAPLESPQAPFPGVGLLASLAPLETASAAAAEGGGVAQPVGAGVTPKADPLGPDAGDGRPAGAPPDAGARLERRTQDDDANEDDEPEDFL